jgi:hypothetical protein
MEPPVGIPVQPRSPADWETVGKRVAVSRRAVGKSVEDVHQALEIVPDDLLNLERGDPALTARELALLADFLETTTGAWVYGDEAPMFRGMSDSSAAVEAATARGYELMMSYLAVAAISS